MMAEDHKDPSLFIVPAPGDGSLLGAVEQALVGHTSALAELPALTNVALGDPYLAQQLADLHRVWSLRPEPARGLGARLRARLAWWLLGAELRQITHVHGTLVRIVDSLMVQLDQERAARRRIEEQLAFDEPRR